MKNTTKTLCALALTLLIFGAGTTLAQDNTGKSSSGSMEDLKQALGNWGQDLKHTASEAGDAVSQWWSESSTSLGEKATAATL